MNEKRTYLLLLVACLMAFNQAFAQTGITNHGTMQLHGDGAAGFHADFRNDGPFENTEGLAGFYSETGSLTLSGSYMPELFDAEFSAVKGIWMDVSVGVSNNANFIHGDVRTSRGARNFVPMFYSESFYTGENRVSKVDGYAGLQQKEEFTFPVGDDTRLRPLTIASQSVNPVAYCAYFPEDPEQPESLDTDFPTDQTLGTRLTVSRTEFWRLEGDIPSRVTLTWDELSNAGGLSQFLADLRVVGWNKAEQAWEDLGNTRFDGGRDYGSITSDYFIPNQYEIITLGGNPAISESYKTVDLDNYYLSPNGDGHNETLEIEKTAEAPDNNLQIYNRYGLLVYQQDNYQGGFNGRSNVDMVVQRKTGLEPGIYFYILTFHDIQERHQGYFYLAD